MKTLADFKLRLLAGEHIFLSNESYQVNIESDDIREAECYYENTLRSFKGYKIWFNGSLIHSSITFESFNKRLNKLIDKWNLEFKTE